MSNHVFVEHSEVFKIIILILNFVRLSIPSFQCTTINTVLTLNQLIKTNIKRRGGGIKFC